MIQVRRKQNGAVLLVSLVMLVVLTLFAISMINLSSIGLRIASNFQAQKVIEQGVQEEMARLISTPASFSSPAAQPDVCINGVDASCTGGYLIRVGIATCINSGPASGYSKKIGELAPQDNDFEVAATVVDPVTGTQYMRVVEGVRVRMLAGSCP